MKRAVEQTRERGSHEGSHVLQGHARPPKGERAHANAGRRERCYAFPIIRSIERITSTSFVVVGFMTTGWIVVKLPDDGGLRVDDETSVDAKTVTNRRIERFTDAELGTNRRRPGHRNRTD